LVLGLALGLLLAAALPGAAGNGDPMLLGRKNHARRVTKLIGQNGLEIRASKNIPLRLYSQDGIPPLQVNRPVLVEDLNADLLDGLEAADLAASDHDHDATYVRRAGHDVDDTQVAIPSSGGDLELLTVPVTNSDECGNGATIHLYLAQAAADIGAQSGPAGSSSSVQAGVTLNSAVILDTTDSSYRTRRVWIGAEAPQRWSLATTGVFAAVPPGAHTFRLLLFHSNTGMTVNSYGASLIVWDLGYWCDEP
jgi:hypothetical protein